MSLITTISTIIGVIIGAVWLGIGAELGRTIYTVLLKTKTTQLLRKFRHDRIIKKLKRLKK